MEGLDDSGDLLAAPVAHCWQMQALPRALSGTDASSSGVNEACVHRQGISPLAADAMAQWLASPQSGHEPALDTNDMSAPIAPRRSHPA